MSGMMDRKGQVGSAEEGPQGWRGRGTERRGGGRTEQSRDKDPRRQKIRLREGTQRLRCGAQGDGERDRERWGGDGARGQSRLPSRQRETETGKDGERDTQETDKWTDGHTQDRGLCGERNQGGRGGGGRGGGGRRGGGRGGGGKSRDETQKAAAEAGETLAEESPLEGKGGKVQEAGSGVGGGGWEPRSAPLPRPGQAGPPGGLCRAMANGMIAWRGGGRQ